MAHCAAWNMENNYNKIFNEHGVVSPEEMESYINGDASPEITRKVELAMASDPFLAEAMEGFEEHKTNIVSEVRQLNEVIRQKSTATEVKTIPLNPQRQWLAIAASVAVLLVSGIIVYNFSSSDSEEAQVAMVESKSMEPKAPEASEEPVIPSTTDESETTAKVTASKVPSEDVVEHDEAPAQVQPAEVADPASIEAQVASAKEEIQEAVEEQNQIATQKPEEKASGDMILGRTTTQQTATDNVYADLPEATKTLPIAIGAFNNKKYGMAANYGSSLCDQDNNNVLACFIAGASAILTEDYTAGAKYIGIIKGHLPSKNELNAIHSDELLSALTSNNYTFLSNFFRSCRIVNNAVVKQ